MSKTVHLIINGGVVEDVEIPEGIRVIIDDYDCPDDFEGPSIMKDDNGNIFQRIEWERS